jgi:hypothetical protein
MRVWLVRSGVGMFCAVLAAWLVLAWPWLSGHVTIPYDAKAHFQAQLQFLASALHRGDSPFWTPNVFAGSPQIADPQSLIFSPALLIALLSPAPSFRMMDAYVFMLLLAGGLAVAMHGRERGWTGLAQVAAAMVFAFGASSAWRLQHVGQIQSLACFAVAFWLLARALRTQSWRSGVGAGAAAGLMLVTPDQIAFLGMYVLAAYALWFAASAGGFRQALVSSVRVLTPGAVVGALIVAAPLLMTLLFAEASSRPEIDAAEAGRGSLHPAFLLTALVADLFGAADPKVEYWGPSSGAWAPGSLTLSQNMGQVYAGVMPLLAVALWLARRPAGIDGDARFALFAFASMTIYALGWYTPVFPLLFEHAPGVDMFRRPADATFMMGSLFALLVGHALTGLAKARGAGVPWRPLIVLSAACVAIFAAAALVAGAHGQMRIALPALLAAGLWTCGAMAVLAVWLSPRGLRFGMAASAAVIAFVAADLRVHNGPNESTALPPALYAALDPATRDPTIAAIKTLLSRSGAEPGRRDRVELLGVGFHWPNAGMIHGFDHAFGYNPLHLAEFTDATGARDHMGEANERRFTPLFPSFRSTFADLLGLRYVVSAVPLVQIDRNLGSDDLRLVGVTPQARIYENPRALPRAMFVGSWRLADFDALSQEGFPAWFEPRGTVLLEQAPDDLAWRDPDAAADARTDVRISRYGNTEVVVTVDTARPGFLVLNDVWHPWWNASVNGEEADILKANAIFRAVTVPAGRSTVVFSFRPLDGAMAELGARFAADDEASQQIQVP